LARTVTGSFAIASEIPSTTADEPGLLDDAESRIAGISLREQRTSAADDCGSLSLS